MAEDSGLAVVVGASGGIGLALVSALRQDGGYDQVLGLHRRSAPALDLLDEASIVGAARHVGGLGAPRLILVATGVLQDERVRPEKSLKALDPAALAHSFAVNAIGPAIVAKHLLPLLPRRGRAVFAVLSARVGSIGDNRLGGWYGYRASKAALNQLVRTAAVELARTHPEAICVALHPGTVATPLSAPHGTAGLRVRAPNQAAADLLRVLNGLSPEQSGGFYDADGRSIPW